MEKLELSFYHQMLGYILGVADAEEGKEFCIPVGTKVEDLIVPVMKVAQASKQQLPAQVTVVVALGAAFPCNGQAGGAKAAERTPGG